MHNIIIKKILIISFFIFFVTPANGETVHLDISDKITANAEFYTGKDNMPFVLILHGFMLTYNFPTVKNLAESLNESDYNIITPNLSLGISQREKSLACEAIHTHSLEQDIAELEQWFKWLENKTDQEIILIGHSTGSTHLINYLSKNPSTKVKKLILIAIPDVKIGFQKNQFQELQIKAEKLIANNDISLQNFKMAYCDKYPTTAENFISYLELSKEKIILNLDKITIDKTLIVGTEDKRVDHAWNKQLTQHGVNIIQIDGANHFFDDEHEFDLLDFIENIINKK